MMQNKNTDIDKVLIQFRPDERRAVALDGDVLAGECTYQKSEGFWVIDHTRVPQAYGGRGIAQRLVEEILGQAKSRGIKIDAQCSYAYKVLKELDPGVLAGE